MLRLVWTSTAADQRISNWGEMTFNGLNWQDGLTAAVGCQWTFSGFFDFSTIRKSEVLTYIWPVFLKNSFLPVLCAFANMQIKTLTVKTPYLFIQVFVHKLFHSNHRTYSIQIWKEISLVPKDRKVSTVVYTYTLVWLQVPLVLLL